MTTYATEFKNLFRERDNIEISETVIGDVISATPLTVSLFNGQAIFSEDKKLYVCESLRAITGTITIDGENKSFSIRREINVGDKVLCVPLAQGQKYAVIDKI